METEFQEIYIGHEIIYNIVDIEKNLKINIYNIIYL